MKYRVCWHDKEGKLQLGELTSLKSFAETQLGFKQMLGYYAWLQDEENNRIES